MKLPNECLCGSKEFRISVSYEPNEFLYVLCVECGKNYGFIDRWAMEDPRVKELVKKWQEAKWKAYDA